MTKNKCAKGMYCIKVLYGYFYAYMLFAVKIVL